MYNSVEDLLVNYLKTIFFNIYAYLCFSNNDLPYFALQYDSGDLRENLTYQTANELKGIFGGTIIEGECNDSIVLKDEFIMAHVIGFWMVIGTFNIYLLSQWYTPSIL